MHRPPLRCKAAAVALAAATLLAACGRDTGPPPTPTLLPAATAEPGARGPAARPEPAVPAGVDPGPARAPGQAASSPPDLRQWVLQTGDNERAPFIIIDKRLARLWLFTDTGQPLGDTPVLLGLARGDASVPGIGERDMKDIRPHERTTPAGRFVAEAGHNEAGEDIFWIDYDAAVSMHRVRATNAVERRLQRLASPTPADNRISYGCINVPERFYNQQIQAAFKGRRGVVYVLPETLPAEVLFKPAKGVPGGL